MSAAVVIPKITKGTWMKVEVDGKIQEYQASRDLYYVREGNYVQVEEEEFIPFFFIFSRYFLCRVS